MRLHFNPAVAAVVSLLTLLFGGTISAFGSRMGPPDSVEPRDYVSPSKEYTWHVDPSHIYGRGEATYQLTRKGVPVWKGKQPFTLYEAGVTDDGLIAGYAYTQGIEGTQDDGDFHVVIMQMDGKLRLNEIVKRKPSRFLHANPTPLASGVIVDAASDRFIVRVDDEDINSDEESWWTYRLSTGKEVGKFALKPPESFVRSPLQAILVPATDLILISCWRYDSPDVGARFALVDQDRNEVWSMKLPRDYQDISDADNSDIWKRGAISAVASNSFTIRSIAASEQITFNLNRDPQKPGKWIVEEVRREKIAADAPAANVEFPVRPLKQLGSFVFGVGSAGLSQVRDIVHFDLDGQGRIGFVRRDTPRQFSFACVDSDGNLVKEIALNVPVDLVTNTSPHVAWLKADRWVVVAARYGLEPAAAAWWIDVATGELVAIDGFICPSVNSISRTGDGGFVILATQRYKASMEDRLIAFDERGKEKWVIKQDYSKGAHVLFSPEDITVTTSGRIAVLDNIRKTVQFFGTDIKFIETWDLEKIWGREPNYPSDISADEKGGVLIRDFNGKPPFVCMNSSGTVTGGFQLKHPDGRVFDAIRGTRVSRSGEIWVCDGECFSRVNGDGVVQKSIGRAPSLEQLGDVAAITVDQAGRLYAVDDRTGAVHVYDAGGKLLRTCKPDVGDVDGKLAMTHVTAGANGTVYLKRNRTGMARPEYIQFGADGKRVGLKRFNLDFVTEEWHVLPHTNRFLVIGYHDAFIVDAAGKADRTIQRRPDGKWLGKPEEASVGPDGSFAIMTGYDWVKSATLDVHLFNPAGDPISTIRLPSGCKTGGAVYTGKYIVTRNKDAICLLDLSGKPVLKFSPAIENFDEVNWDVWQFFTVNEGRELWLVAGTRKTVWRFELPQAVD